jgi:hypothetical protein
MCIMGLDRLDARFPLCAREPVLVPAVIALLKRRGITTLVTSIQSEADLTARALLPMGDVVLHFTPMKSFPEWVEIQALRVPNGAIGRHCAYATWDRDNKLQIGLGLPEAR